MSDEIKEFVPLFNDLVHAIEALQKAGVGCTIEQLETGKFDVTPSLNDLSIEVIADYHMVVLP